MNIDDWAIWEETQHTCLEVVQKTWEISYNFGFKDGIIFGLIIAFIFYKVFICKNCSINLNNTPNGELPAQKSGAEHGLGRNKEALE